MERLGLRCFLLQVLTSATVLSSFVVFTSDFVFCTPPGHDALSGKNPGRQWKVSSSVHRVYDKTGD